MIAELISAILGIGKDALEGIFSAWRKRRRSAVIVRRIQSPNDSDLPLALGLLRLLPDNEQDTEENIVRWLDEVKTEHQEDRCNLEDYFVIAKVGTRVCGLLYSHYYPRSRLMFISYMIIDGDVYEAKRCFASTALLTFLTREIEKKIAGCEGIVFELDDPACADKKQDRMRCLARARHFKALARTQNLVVKQIGIRYRQPKLSLWETGYSEQQLALLYGRTRGVKISSQTTRSEVERILRFVYLDVYGDHFEDDPERDRSYRAYLNKLWETSIKDLSPDVPLL